MAERSSVATPRTTVPVHLEEARRLAAELATLPTDELARLLRVNRRIAAENHLRYRHNLPPERRNHFPIHGI